jgi:hypothetical protein
MRKDKSGDRFGKVSAEHPQGERFSPRKESRFQIGPNSSPRKVVRWLNRGGGSPLNASIEVIAKRHIHPRSDRRLAA